MRRQSQNRLLKYSEPFHTFRSLRMCRAAVWKSTLMKLVYLPLSNLLVHHLPSPHLSLFHSPLERGLVMSNSHWSERGHIFSILFSCSFFRLPLSLASSCLLREISSPKHLHMFTGRGQESCQHNGAEPGAMCSPGPTWGPSVSATFEGEHHGPWVWVSPAPSAWSERSGKTRGEP